MPRFTRLLLLSAFAAVLAFVEASAVNSAPAGPGYGHGPAAPSALFFEGGTFIPQQQQQPQSQANEDDNEGEGGEYSIYDAMAMAAAAAEEQHRQQQQEQVEQELMMAAARAQAQRDQQRLEEEEMARERFAHILAAVAAQQQDYVQLPETIVGGDYFVPATSLDTTDKQQQKESKTKGGTQLKQRQQQQSKQSAKSESVAKSGKTAERNQHQQQQEEKSASTQTNTKMVPAKKGQYEFVEFAEPLASAKLRGIESMDKRVPSEFSYYGSQPGGFFRGFTNSGNLLFIAAVAMCCALATVGVAGGAYYYTRVRAAHDDPFDEFMRYSPTGPGRDKLKKAHLPPTSRFSPTSGGDDTLAYKAQLQHYRQAKQRIVGAGGLAVQPACTDDEDFYDDDDELNNGNNFSVYECPGLAPAGGDIAVENPNFVGAKSPSPVPSQGSPSRH